MKVVKEKHLNKHASLGWKEKRLVSATTFFFFSFLLGELFLLLFVSTRRVGLERLVNTNNMFLLFLLY